MISERTDRTSPKSSSVKPPSCEFLARVVTVGDFGEPWVFCGPAGSPRFAEDAQRASQGLRFDGASKVLKVPGLC
jgi:hypothetical protein